MNEFNEGELGQFGDFLPTEFFNLSNDQIQNNNPKNQTNNEQEQEYETRLGVYEFFSEDKKSMGYYLIATSIFQNILHGDLVFFPAQKVNLYYTYSSSSFKGIKIQSLKPKSDPGLQVVISSVVVNDEIRYVNNNSVSYMVKLDNIFIFPSLKILKRATSDMIKDFKKQFFVS